jgi:choice-of-anchor C domain-containing protein
MNKLIVIATIALCMFLSTAIFAQMITNGSFENSVEHPGIDPGSFMTLNAPDSNSVYGWTIEVGNVDYIGNYWEASNGLRSIDLNGYYAKAVISQSVTTIPGVTYQVTFDLSGNPDGAPVTKSVTVGVNGSVATEGIFTYTVDPLVNTHEDMNYSRSNTYYFVATGTSTILRFTSNTNFLDGNASAFGPVLDNVAMAPITAQICHLDSGKRTKKTIIVGLSAIAAHIAHGDPSPAGPCTAS